MKEINKYVGFKIRQRRKQLDLSQEDLGKILGISSQQVHKYESGLNKISASMLFACAKAFNIPITYFYDGIKFNDPMTKEVANTRLCCSRKTPLSVLFVEDNPVDEMLFRKALEKCDKEISMHTVYNGVDALQFLRNDNVIEPFKRPDLVFLDLNIPKRGGFEVLKEIKKDRKLMDIPVIILTNTINPDDMYKSYQLGASGFMNKSFDIKEFNTNVALVVECWSQAMILPSMQNFEKEMPNPVLLEA